MEQIIIDAKDFSLGRIASLAVKQSLLGNAVIIVNCNEIIISGKKESILSKYQRLRSMKSSSLKGPNFPKSPERILKRTIRGMLPYKQERGRKALKRIKCYNDVPEEYKDKEKISFKKEFSTKTFKLKEISKLI